jgi:Cadherin domain
LNFGPDVLQVATDFLAAHPTETIVMKVQTDVAGRNNTKSFDQVFHDYEQQTNSNTGQLYGSYIYQATPAARVPANLGAARGKIIIVQSDWDRREYHAPVAPPEGAPAPDNNQAPSAPVDSDSTYNAVDDGASAGTRVWITASSSDPGGGTVSYSLTDDAGGRFAVDASTGVVTVATGAVIDFESSGGSYAIKVKASDGTLDSPERSFVIPVYFPAQTVDPNFTDQSIFSGYGDWRVVDLDQKSSLANDGFDSAAANLPPPNNPTKFNVTSLDGNNPNVTTSSSDGQVVVTLVGIPFSVATGNSLNLTIKYPTSVDNYVNNFTSDGVVPDLEKFVEINWTSGPGMISLADAYIRLEDSAAPTGIVVTDFAPLSLIQAIYDHNPFPRAEITWGNPANIPYGQALSATQLSASVKER